MMLVRMFKRISIKPFLKLALFLTVLPVNWTVSWRKKTCFFLEGCNTKKTVMLGIINTLAHASLFPEKDCFIHHGK